MNFTVLEEDLNKAIAADEKYQRENSAKFRAVEQKVTTYDEFKDIVKASHLKPLDKKEKISFKNVIWNVVANKSDKQEFIDFPNRNKKKHFTEK